jgi:hypothetical protein
MASIVRVGTISRRRLLVALPLFSVAALSACSTQSAPANLALLANPARNQWPDQFWQAAPDVQEDYRFAVANPEVLRYIPCYCGCVNQGMSSNHDCYVQETRSDGTVILDPMSFG